MKKMLNSNVFWIALVAVFIVVLAVGTNMSKKYRGEMDILVLPRNESTARNIDQVLNNVRQIPMSLSFYNKLVELNPDIVDEFAELPDKQRKEGWNSKLKTEIIKKSGIVRVTILDEDQLQAEIISERTAQDIVVVLNRYYNVQTDLDLRIIDGPILDIISAWNAYKLTAISLLIGILAGILIFVALAFFEKNEIAVKSISLEKYFKPETLFSKSASVAKTKEKIQGIKPSEDVYHIEKKGVAPANLPTADMPIFTSQTKFESKQEAEIKNEIARQAVGEATPEEVKARLNKLLNC